MSASRHDDVLNTIRESLSNVKRTTPPRAPLSHTSSGSGLDVRPRVTIGRSATTVTPQMKHKHMLDALLARGFEEEKCLMALKLTDFRSIDVALKVLQHSQTARPDTSTSAMTTSLTSLSPRSRSSSQYGNSTSCTTKLPGNTWAPAQPPVYMSNYGQTPSPMRVSGAHTFVVNGEPDDISDNASTSTVVTDLINRAQRLQLHANQSPSKPIESPIMSSSSLMDMKRESTASEEMSEIGGGMDLVTAGDMYSTDEPIRCISPLPHSILGDVNFESPVQECRPAAFRFYMEQHIENVIKHSQDRKHRLLLLERDMTMANFSEQVQTQMRRILAHKESKYLRSSRQKLNESMFANIQTIGVGAFGKVVLVRKTDTDALYAMKILHKTDVIALKQAAHVKAERDILCEANSEWVVKLYCSFQDDTRLFFIMEYIAGGDLMSLLIREEIFTEQWALFYTAELVAAIDYVHRLQFIHRDIKPDNVLIDVTGHIKLTDFGLCTGLRWTHDKKYYDASQSTHNRADSFDLLQVHGNTPKLLQHRRDKRKRATHSLVGTSNYMAPEVLLSNGHDKRCDWWSVGVILYEMVVGIPPFYAPHPHDTQRKVIDWRQYLHIPMDRGLSEEVVDLIQRLCCDKEDRIGQKGMADFARHPFFSTIDIDLIRETEPPYKPYIESPTDTRNFDQISTPSDEEINNNAEPSTPKTKKERSKKSDKGSNPAFYEFTFRHFFDMEPMGSEGETSTGGGKQRASLAPLLEIAANHPVNADLIAQQQNEQELQRQRDELLISQQIPQQRYPPTNYAQPMPSYYEPTMNAARPPPPAYPTDMAPRMEYRGLQQFGYTPTVTGGQIRHGDEYVNGETVYTNFV